MFSFGERQAAFFFSGHFGLNDFLALLIGADIHRQFCFSGIGGDKLFFSLYSFLTTLNTGVRCEFVHFIIPLHHAQQDIISRQARLPSPNDEASGGQASLSGAGRAGPP